MEKMIRLSGFALMIAGFFFAVPNTAILPFVDFNAPFGELMTSNAFFYRMIIAALTVAFLSLGSIGLFLHQSSIKAGSFFRQVAFITAFFGSVFMLANEWHQIFVLPQVASINSEVINELGATSQTGRYGIGAMIAFSLFSLGWILFSTSLVIGKQFKRLGPILIILGFFMIPLLSALVTPVAGGIIGGISLGIGFFSVGFELIKGA